MRWVVTADLHWSNALPYSVIDWETGESDRLHDLARLCSRLVRIGEERGAKGLLILGDYFDQKRLDAVTLTVASRSMKRLAQHFEKVWVIPGNHDSHDSRLRHFNSKWLESVRNVYVPTEPVTIPGERIRLFPYAPLSALRKTLADERPDGPMLAGLHATFKGASEYGFTFRDGLIPQDVKPFKCVLSGHVHAYQKLIGVPHGFYVGSPMPMDWRDESAKFVWIVDGQSLEIEQVRLPSKIALPFRTVEVDLFEDGSIRNLADRLPKPVGYLRLTVRGSKGAVRKFVDKVVPSISGYGFRRVIPDERIVRDKTTVRSKEVAASRSDLRKSLTVWVESLTLPADADRNGLVKRGVEFLESALSEAKTVPNRRVKVELERLYIKDFGPIGEVDLDLKSAGVVSVRADNLDSTGADSNGSGKTHLFKAITWALYGRTIYPQEKGNSIIRNGEPEAVVELVFLADGKRVSVRRSKKTTASAVLTIEQDGKPLTGGVTDLQDEVQRLVGLDFDTFRNTVLFGQNDTKRFADPSSSDATRKAILRDVLGIGVLDVARDIVKRQQTTDAESKERLDNERSRLEGTLAGLDIDGLETKQKAWGANLKDEVLAIRVEANQLFRKANAGAPDLKALERRLKGAEAKEEAARAAIDIANDETKRKMDLIADQKRNLSVERATVKTSYTVAWERCKELEDDRCPTCGNDLKSGGGLRAVTEAKAERKRLADALAKLETDWVNLLDREGKTESLCRHQRETGNKALSEAKAARESARNALDEAKSEAADRKAMREVAKRRLDEADEAEKRENPYTTMLVRAETTKADTEVRIAGTDKLLRLLARTARALDFWYDGFGSAGLQSWIMDAIAEPLNDKANDYLRVLSDGDIRITIDTVTKLKSGEFRDKFSITADIERNGETTPSGGQLKKIELATGLALMDLVAEREGANVDLLCLDEVFDGLDATGKARVILLLDSLRKTKGTILVVSHDTEVKGEFDRVWTVTKRDGVSSVTVTSGV